MAKGWTCDLCGGKARCCGPKSHSQKVSYEGRRDHVMLTVTVEVGEPIGGGGYQQLDICDECARKLLFTFGPKTETV